jgi:hypothetical protein
MPALCLAQTDAQNARYKVFLDNFKSSPENQRAAYNAAREYMQNSPKDPQVAAYISKWMAKYEAATREFELLRLVFVQKDYPAAVKSGTSALASDPDNVKILFVVALGAYLQQNTSPATTAAARADVAVGYEAALHAISLIKSGKQVPSEQPFNGEEQTLAQLEFYAGSLKRYDQPEQAIVFLTQAVQHKSYLSSKPEPYLTLLEAYTKIYAHEKSSYDEQFASKPQTPESTQRLEQLNELIERMVDCYARTLSYSETDSQYKDRRGKWLDRATELYSFRHGGSNAGLDALLSGVEEKPVPNPPAFVVEASARAAK